MGLAGHVTVTSGAPLRILFVEDDPNDVEAVLRILREGGYDPEARVATTRAQFREALAHAKFDLVIADDQLSRFDGMSALALLKDNGRDVPFFLVSGEVGEERAVATMKAGAADFILKGNLARLVPAVGRELREVQEREGRRVAEQTLHRREEQLRLALNAARMGTWDWDLQTGRFIWSEHAEAILGQGGSTIPRTRAAYLAAIPADDRAVVEEAIEAAITSGTDYQVAHRIAVGDGRVRWLGLKGRVYQEDGHAPRMSGTVADITDRKEAEAALVESEQRYRDLYEEAPVALFSVNRAGDIVRANREAAILLGRHARDLVGRNTADLFADTVAGRERVEALLPRAMAGSTILNETVELEREDREPWWGSLSIKPVLNADGEVVVLRATLIDITTRLRTQELLQLSQRVIDQSPDLIMVCDRDYVYRRVNSAHARAHGRSAQDLVGHSIPEIIGEQPFLTQVKPRFDRCLAGEDVSYEMWIDYKGPGRRYMNLTYTPLRASEGEVEGVIIVGRDVTERRLGEERREELEAQLRQAQKMEALGTLAGGIAHDFNNLLLVILGYGELVRDAVQGDEELREQADHVLMAGERAQKLVQQILAFGRRNEQELRPVLMQDVVREAIGFLRATLPTTIEIQPRLVEEPCAVLGDASQLQQVVLNLASNALHAMRETGGLLELGVARADVDATLAERLGGLAPGPYVCLSVRDTGHGMPEEIYRRIYDPFFTTKGPGEGTGLGLSVVHGIVMSHGGGLHVETEPGKGTRFDLYFPRTDVFAEAEIEGPPAAHGSERVLFIDDEEQLAALGKQMLGRLGYQVTTMTSSEEAVRRFSEAPGDWDIVITDQTMPRLTGLDVVRIVREERPDLPVIITTGFSESISSDTVAREGIDALVMKPYGGADLARAVRQALDHVNAAAG